MKTDDSSNSPSSGAKDTNSSMSPSTEPQLRAFDEEKEEIDKGLAQLGDGAACGADQDRRK